MKAPALAPLARPTTLILTWSFALAAVALAAPPRSNPRARSARPASRSASRPSSRASSKPASRPGKRPATIGIKQVTHDMLKQTVTVEGLVELDQSRITRTRKRRIFQYSISNGDSLIDAVWWEDLGARLKPDQMPHIGDHVRVTGVIAEYRRGLQIQPGWPEDIEVLEHAPPAKPAGK